MLIKDTPFTAIDFESAGTATGKTDAPIQIGTVTWSIAEGISDQWMSYITTDQDITWAAQKVHGITKEDLLDAPKMALLWPPIKRRLKQGPVVAHGYGTEKRFLRAFPGHGFGPWIDTLLLSRSIWPELESHSLGNLCDRLDLTPEISTLVPEKTWHDALYDSVASIVLLKHIITTYNLADKSVQLLESPTNRQWMAGKKG